MPGFQFIEVPAGAAVPALKGAMWYPCAAPPGDIDLGRDHRQIRFHPARREGCLINGDKLPLVVASHGKGSHFVLHHDTAETLADAGFIVAAINHPGDNDLDMSRSAICR